MLGDIVFQKEREENLFGVKYLLVVFGSTYLRKIGNPAIIQHGFDPFGNSINGIFIRNSEFFKKPTEPFDADSKVLIGIKIHVGHHSVTDGTNAAPNGVE